MRSNASFIWLTVALACSSLSWRSSKCCAQAPIQPSRTASPSAAPTAQPAFQGGVSTPGRMNLNQPATPAPVISSGRNPARESIESITASDPSWTATGPQSSFRDSPPVSGNLTTRAQSDSSPSSPPGSQPMKTSTPRAEVVPAQYTSKESAIPGLRRNELATSATGISENASTEKSGGSRPLKPPTNHDQEKEKRTSGTAQLFVSVASSLLIVIGLVLGAAWCYRRAMPGATSSMPKQVLQVLGRTPLTPRQQLVLIRFGHKLVLVSNLQGEVRTISEITDPLEVDRMAGICESSQAGSISDSFRSVLHNLGRNG